jgi:peptidoglycan hydrolase-like protein with peptidoglycan-binding domain
MRKLILTTASVLALGIGGAGIGFAGNMSQNAPNAGAPPQNMPATQGTSQYNQNAGANMQAAPGAAQNEQAGMRLSSSEIKQAQQQLRDQGLYHGAIDGVFGPETKQALGQFQQKNGLPETATLDQQTMNKLLGSANAGQGTSMPPTSTQGTGPTANPRNAPPAGSNLGDHTAPNK